jgi:quinol monooxygenase YgiN
VRFIIRFEVLDAERFREMAARMVEVSRDELGTVVYDWYLDDGGTTGVLYEAYASQDALTAHSQGAVFTDIGPAYFDCVRVVAVDAFGAAEALERRKILGAPTTWWGASIAAVTESRD